MSEGEEGQQAAVTAAPPVEALTPPPTTTTTSTTTEETATAAAAAVVSVTKEEEETPAAKTPVKKKRVKLKPEDFNLIRLLGKGAYANVMLAERKSDGVHYAIKIVDKRFITKNNKVEAVMNEKKVLSIISHPGIVKLHFTFQDAHSLYYVLSLAEAGELYDDLARAGKYSVEATRFYAAELVQILAYLHGKNIVHRDLKPENILISQSRHLKLTDFGTSKIMRTRMEGKQGGKERRKSFVGTAEYVSPEVLGDRPAGKAADMWALGCVLFQMCTGTVPFRGESEYLTFKKIENFDMKTFPDDTEASLQDLIMKLLVVTPEERLGSTPAGYDLLRAHPFFAGVEWDTLWTQKPPSIVYINPSLTEQQLDSDETDSDEEAFNNTGRSEVKLEAETVSNSKKYSKWQQFLEPGESIIYTGFISKRRGLYAKKRQLILTNFPRFIYVDTIAMVVRGTIPWSETLRGEVKTARQFYIHIPKRSYYMVGLSCGSRDWVNMIDKVKEVYTGETYFPVPKVE